MTIMKTFFAGLTREIPFCPLGLPECSQDLGDFVFSGMFPQFFKRINSQSFRFLSHHVSRKSGLNRNLILNSPMSVPILELTPLGLSLPQRLPLGVPIKIANINEKLNARGGAGETMGRGERASLLSFPFPSCSGRFLFLSFQPPCDTKRPISRGKSLYGARAFQYKPTSISSPHQIVIKLNFKRRRVEKSDFYLAENIQLILQNKNDTSRLDFSHDYKYLQKA